MHGPHHWPLFHNIPWSSLIPHSSPLLWWSSLTLSGLGLLAQKVSPQSPVGAAAVIMGLVALVGAIGAQIDAYRKRSIEIEGIRQKQAETSKRQDLTEKAVMHNRRKMVKVEERQGKMEESIKGIELLRNIGGLVDSSVEKKKSILVVDDDPSDLNQFGRFLVKNLADFNLMLAIGVDDAMKRLPEIPDWMFIDIKLGERSGIELVVPAKSYNPTMTIVAITGWKDPEELQGAVALGVDIFTKPLSQDDLKRLVLRLRRDFGVPIPSSDAIPVAGVSGIRKGISEDETDG